MKLLEKDVKRAVDDFLQYGQNQGRWVYLRLNSGDFIVGEGKARRRIRGCQKGTADYLALTNNGRYAAPNKFYCIPIFIEVKSPTGRQSIDQIVFQALVEVQGAEYHLVRSVEELDKILG